jgi:hypothetical protein
VTDYESLKKENQVRYGTDIGRIGPMLLAHRYDDRTHFVYELLQNGEDALARRKGWEGSRAVQFTLSKNALRVSHTGKPFDEPDVRGICGIGESTKDLTDIGRFGIGFKSVYAFTNRPEVHSGEEHFAIESFVWPIAVPRVACDPDETIFVLPLDHPEDTSAHEDIINAFKRLGPRSLLFLRQIEEISWNVENGPTGVYLRSKPELIADNVRRFTLIGEEDAKPDIEQSWLVFSREARTDHGVLQSNQLILRTCCILPDRRRDASWVSHPRSLSHDAEPRQRAARRSLEPGTRRGNSVSTRRVPALAS